MSVPMKMLNVRIPADVHQTIDTLARSTGRTKSFLALEAIRDFLERERWQIADISEGIAEANRGEFASDTEVTATISKYGA